MNRWGCRIGVLVLLTSIATVLPVQAEETRPEPAPSVKARNKAVIASLSCESKPRRLTAHAAQTDVAGIFQMIGPISGVRFRIVGPPKSVRVLGFHVVDQTLCDVLAMLADKLDLAFALSPKDGAIEVTVGTDKKEVDLSPIQRSS